MEKEKKTATKKKEVVKKEKNEKEVTKTKKSESTKTTSNKKKLDSTKKKEEKVIVEAEIEKVTSEKVKKEKSDKKSKKEKKEKKESFFKSVRHELSKVTWPSKRNMVKYSIATIIFIIFFALYFYCIELLMAWLKANLIWI